MAKTSKKTTTRKKASRAKRTSKAKVVPCSVFAVRRNANGTPKKQVVLALDDATIIAKPAEAIVDIDGSTVTITAPGQFKVVAGGLFIHAKGFTYRRGIPPATGGDGIADVTVTINPGTATETEYTGRIGQGEIP